MTILAKVIGISAANGRARLVRDVASGEAYLCRQFVRVGALVRCIVIDSTLVLALDKDDKKGGRK